VVCKATIKGDLLQMKLEPTSNEIKGMTDFSENATPQKSTKSKNSNSSVQIQNKPRSHFELVPRDTEDSKFLDLVDFGCVAFSVETVIEIGLFVSWLYNPCYTPRAC